MTVISQAAGIGQPDDANVVISSSIDIIVDGVKVGAIDSFNVNVSRAVQRVRELNSEIAGRTIEIVPGPEESSITVSGFMLYAKGLESLFRRVVPGADGGNEMVSIGQQYKPFDIVEKYTHPATKVSFYVVYKGVWLTNYSKSQNINTAVVVENATMEVQGITAKTS